MNPPANTNTLLSKLFPAFYIDSTHSGGLMSKLALGRVPLVMAAIMIVGLGQRAHGQG